MFINVELDAHEGRDVTTFDTPGEYLYIDTYKDVIMLLEVSLDYLVVKVAPTISQKYVIMSSKGNPILYVQIQKVLYCLLRSALLLYRNW